MTKTVIHQPNLFPRLKVLQKIFMGDIWVVFDDVQYVKREWQNRTKLRQLNDVNNSFWLTIPVHRPNGQSTLIKDVQIINPPTTFNQMRKSLRFTYGKSRYWKWIFNYSEHCFNLHSSLLSEFCLQSTLAIYIFLGLQIEFIRSSDLRLSGSSTQKLINICNHLQSKTYISGSGGRNYLDEDLFTQAEIEIIWQNWTEPLTQTTDTGSPCWRNVSFLDFLARFGPRATRQIITKTCSKVP